MDSVNIKFVNISVGLCDDTIELLLLVAAGSVAEILDRISKELLQIDGSQAGNNNME